MSTRASVKTVTYTRKPTAAYRAKAARMAAYSSSRVPRAPAAARGFVPLSSWKRGRGIRGETKATDFPVTASTFALNSAAGNLACLNLTQAGSSFFNRIGRKICLKSVYLNGFIDPISANDTTNEYLRIIMVYDSQTNGATPTWADVVQATTQNNATSSLALDGFNLNNRDRFKIVLDKRFTAPNTVKAADLATTSNTLPTPTQDEWKVQEYRKLNNLETQYKADSSPAVIGDVATGGLFLLSQGSVGAQFAFVWSARLRFTDN